MIYVIFLAFIFPVIMNNYSILSKAGSKGFILLCQNCCATYKSPYLHGG